MSVRELRERCTAREIDALIALWSLEPRGDRRDDLRIAHQTLVLGSIALGAAGAKNKRLKLEDVLLKFEEPGGPEDPQKLIDSIKAMLQASTRPGD